MIFGTDEYELIKTGEYEVKIDRIDKKPYTDKEGNNKIGARVAFKIRDDVNQEGKGRYVWEFFFADKADPANWIDTSKIKKIVNTQPPMSYDKDDKPQWNFEDLDACIQYLTGINLRVTIDREFDNYKGEEVNIIKFMSYRKSQATTLDVPASPASNTVEFSGNVSAEELEQGIANGLGNDPLPF